MYMKKIENNQIVESYNEEEKFLYNDTYMFIKGFAFGRNLKYALKALPLARKVHNGQYRKGTFLLNGKEYRLPYLLHVLKVASTLISLDLEMNNAELDILITCALLHDTLEDAPEGFFKHDGTELVTDYGFPTEVYETVKLLSKRSGANEEELGIYFNAIKRNKFALLIKMADRSHNVEDLYNMKIEKLHKYVVETRKWIYPLSSYAKENYPELSSGVTILKSKIVSLTESTETITELYEEKMEEKDKEIKELKALVSKLERQTKGVSKDA